MGIRKFEDLKAWMLARELTTLIYRNFSVKKDYGFWSQITRASMSVMNNISEGFESGTDKEFIRYLGYSKASCGEVRGMIYAALDIGYIDEQLYLILLEKCRITSGTIVGLRKYLQKCKK